MRLAPGGLAMGAIWGAGSATQELEPSSCALATNALMRLGWSGPGAAGALQALGAHAAACADRLEAAGVTQMLHACGRAPELRENGALVGALLERARTLVPESSPHSLSLLVHTCARLRERDVPLLTQAAHASHSREHVSV